MTETLNLPASHSPTSRWTLSTPALLQAVLLAGVFILSFFGETDPDLWWHLGTGRFIVESGHLPQTDPFSYTAIGTQWIIPEWLGEVTIYFLYAAGGYVLAVAFFGAVVTLTYWLILRSSRILGLDAAPATLVAAWSAALSWPFWMVRPHIVSFMLFALYLYLLIRSRKQMDLWLWLLPPAMTLWVNFHSGYVMGFLVLGLFLAGEYINRAWKARSLGPKSSIVETLGRMLKSYLPVTLASVVGATINPEGPQMLIYPLTYVGGRNFNLNYVTEWSSPNFHEPYLVVFGASLIFMILLSTRRRMDWAVTLPLLAVTWMSLEWVRSIPFFAVAFAPYLATRLPGTSTERSLARPAVKAPALNWYVLVLAVSVMASTLFLTDRAQLGREPRLDGFPVEGVGYIQQSGLEGKMFNTYHWGGYILWRFYGERRVFIDGRTDMYGAAIFKDYRDVANVEPGWREVLDKYDVRVMLIGKGSALQTLLLATGGWKEVFSGKVETVLVRK